MIKPLMVSLASVLSPMGAQALMSCDFTTECLDADTCADTDFQVELSGDSTTLSTVFGDLTVDFHDRGTGAMTYVAHTDSAAYFLTTYDTGGARFTMHSTDMPMALTYLGRCEGGE